MKHTKGKWVVYPRWSYRKGVSAKDTTQNEPDGYSVEAQRDAYRNDISIASIQTYSDGKRPMDEVQANANLIASAPEMLELLKKCYTGEIEEPYNNDELNAFISKAEGK